MVTQGETTQIYSGVLTDPVKGAIRLGCNAARIVGVLLLLFSVGALGSRAKAESNGHDSALTASSDWSQLISSMDKMHMAMSAVKQSGNSDVDFVRLMLPHHQAAIDMAKTELLYGKDLQMRRLAQEIITDQQLEIQLMQRWLQQHAN